MGLYEDVTAQVLAFRREHLSVGGGTTGLALTLTAPEYDRFVEEGQQRLGRDVQRGANDRFVLYGVEIKRYPPMDA